MNFPKIFHSAILLPTGKVLVVGGITSVSGNPDGTTTDWYPTEAELYDPDSNVWSIMDDLGYGLENPQLVLQQDGGVFVTGFQIVGTSPSQEVRVGNTKNKSTQMFYKNALSNHEAIISTKNQAFGLILPPPIVITWHFVRPSLNMHTALRITPTNQSQSGWVYNSFWGPYFQQNQYAGKFFLTLSGVPSDGLDVLISNATLISKVNNSRDVTSPQDGFLNSNFVISPQNEDAVIGQILATFSGYQNDIPYTLFPVNGSQYNSNSFCHGLINAAGFGSCVPVTHWLFSGWNNPVPSLAFSK